MWWKKGIEILWLTLQRHNKFLKERENKQLLQVQSVGPHRMDGHHQWYATDGLTSSQNKQAMEWSCKGIKSIHVYHFLQICCLLYVWNYTVKLSLMLQGIVACSLDIAVHTLYIMLVGMIFVAQRSWHLSL